ncbi:hypothetical protein PybrP1_004247 [[Pythium] brassicae (nom. inval.)]|nr:hypothetical protein PybrP1_004247 [[Pythium] brassicae (nom. inval.)]
MVGRIYKIVHSQSDVVYVGMTMNSLSKRWTTHKKLYNEEKNQNSNITIYEYMVKHSVDQFKILLIKEYDVIDRKHLKVYETLWMNKLKCVNKLLSFNPMNDKQQSRACYLKNCEERCTKVRAYAAANTDLIKRRTKHIVKKT